MPKTVSLTPWTWLLATFLPLAFLACSEANPTHDDGGGTGGSGFQSGGSGGGASVSSGGASSGGRNTNDSGGSASGGGLLGTGGAGGVGPRSGGSTGAGGSDGANTSGGSSAGGTGAGDGGAHGSGGEGASAATGGGGGGEGSSLADAFPCDGTTQGYEATVIQDGGSWTVQNGGSPVYSGGSMQAALEAAFGSLTSGRSTKESVLVVGSGEVSGSAQLRVPSYTVLNVCGTIHVTNDVSGSDRSPIYARGATDIDIPHVTITGSAQYGMFFRDVSNLHLGHIQINGTGGLGVRIDSHGSDDRNSARNITIDYIIVENTGGHGVELYGVDGIDIGTVIARSTGDCGLILNHSINAEIDLVDAVSAAHIGTGYAAFRTANNNGQYDDGSYPTNIVLHELRASGADAGRGFFCVSQSGGLLIEKFEIDDVGGEPALFIENCYNVTMAGPTGTGVLRGGEAYIGHNSGNGDAARDITFQNITLSSGASVGANNATCGNNNRTLNVSGGNVNVCN